MRKIQARPFMLFCLPLYPVMGALVLRGGFARRWGGERWFWWAAGQGMGLLGLFAALLVVRTNRALDAMPSLQVLAIAYLAGLLVSGIVTLVIVARPGAFPGLSEALRKQVIHFERESGD